MDIKLEEQIKLAEKVKLAAVTLFSSGANEGIAVTAYGQGQLSGVTYSVPAHGEISVDFSIKLMCVTPEDIKKLDALIRSLLDASKQHLYEEIEKTHASGGVGFFGFWAGSASASYDKTKHILDSWGLSEENQRTIVNAMMQLVQQMSTFNYKGTVYNKDYDYAVSGNLFAIVMDCSIQQGTAQNQVRLLAPNVHLESSDGKDRLPVIGKLYN
jgi:hypothetical protein